MSDEIRRLLDEMLTDLRRLGCHRREPCGVHAKPQWTCGFCLTNLLEGVEALLPALPPDDSPLLKSVYSLDGRRLLARFYDYDYFEEVMRALPAAPAAPRAEEQGA